MKSRRFVAAVVGSAALAAVPVAAQAGSQTDRVTGGGQTMVGTKGAGDTIAFTAQGTGQPGGGRGQIQYVDRQGGTGQAQETFHYVVDCVAVMGNAARIGGFERDTGAPIEIMVTDNGEGANAMMGGDMISIDQMANGNCTDDQGEDQPEAALARGNAQVHDAGE